MVGTHEKRNFRIMTFVDLDRVMGLESFSRTWPINVIHALEKTRCTDATEQDMALVKPSLFATYS